MVAKATVAVLNVPATAPAVFDADVRLKAAARSADASVVRPVTATRG
jgi:hypothetical protein